MSIENIPEIYINKEELVSDLFVYDFKMTEDVVRTKVNLSMNMFSFLQEGKKQVHFADTSVMVNNEQSLLIKKGNLLWTELLDKDNIYYCKLFFFSEGKLKRFLEKNVEKPKNSSAETPYFTLSNDDYISGFLSSLSSIHRIAPIFKERALNLKFEEILFYLLSKYGRRFEEYLYSLIAGEKSSFQQIVESNVFSNLNLEEIAFLCNMSLSSFKRNFTKEFGESPGKWIKDQRLQRAKQILAEGEFKASDIYLDFGYSNLSNFSAAFKNKFGVNPTELGHK
ncbi:AraC family transcriptional regulator [Puteibacter caeruleilacunae]|nr:AraC family transcriptional regulator [Puteibacter caeruleilacunae]